jgi:hypothetical protein
LAVEKAGILWLSGKRLCAVIEDRTEALLRFVWLLLNCGFPRTDPTPGIIPLDVTSVSKGVAQRMEALCQLFRVVFNCAARTQH